MATYCGTNDGTIVYPNDPSNDSTLSAAGVFGGIDVTWTYPGTNPEAVVHTRLYRGTTNDPALKILHHIVDGNFFYDKVTASVTYYYWIEIVSINGTVGDLIGPAMASAKPPIEHVMLDLAGKLEKTHLVQSLKDEINYIPTLDQKIVDETDARKLEDGNLTTSINGIKTDYNNLSTTVSNEKTARIDGDNALASDLNTVSTTVDGNTATLQTHATSINGLEAQYTVKADANGHVAGFGLANYPSDSDGSDTNTSSFVIHTDRFAMTHPSNFWRANNAYVIGDFVQPSSKAKVTNKNLVYECTAADDGADTNTTTTSGATEPTWPSTVGSTVTDGELTWTARNVNTRYPFIISNGSTYIDVAVIKDASIGDAKITSLNATKITAGTLDASKVSVTNLDASNITAGTLTGRTIQTAPSGTLPRAVIDAVDNSIRFFAANSAGTETEHARMGLASVGAYSYTAKFGINESGNNTRALYATAYGRTATFNSENEQALHAYGNDRGIVVSARVHGGYSLMATGNGYGVWCDHKDDLYAPIVLGSSAFSAVPTHSALKGSLFVSSTGALYINTNGSTGWSTVGGPAALGAVGTYALMACYYTMDLAPGATLAASDLKYATASSVNTGTPAGTWRLMGYHKAYDSYNGMSSNHVSLWLRIS